MEATVRVRIGIALALLGLLALGLAGCGAGGALLSGVKITPDTISPNGDGKEDIAVVSYRVGQAGSRLTITLFDEQGNAYPFREGEPRSAGEFNANFSGVVEKAVSLTPYYDATQAAVLPDGRYRVLVEVENGGRTESAETALTIRGGDGSPPGFGDFSVFTPSFDETFRATRGERVVFTPNRDGIGDRVAVSYWLSREATVEVYLIRTDDERAAKYAIASVAKLKPGRQNHDYEGGVDLGNTPPPNGDYLVVAEAKDAIGNHAVLSQPLTVADGGVPLAHIVSASISPVTIPLSGTLRVEVVVENVGAVAIRSQGPYSGTVYTNAENYNTKGFFENPGVFRICADYEGNPSGAYPFRWGLAGDKLLPGERQTVIGYIQITSPTTKGSLYFWTGLRHEQVGIIDDKVKPTLITVGF